MNTLKGTPMIGYKILTHDNRPPLQGGDPLIPPGQSLPYALPPVALDTSAAECAPGYHFCHTPEEAIRIVGLWPDGRPSRLYRVTATDAIERGSKLRAATLTIEHEFTESEWRDAVAAFSAPFAPFVAEMAESQMLWREALARPHRDELAVETGLRAALEARGLSEWTLKRFQSARDARVAWVAWDAWDARDARDARDAWDARMRRRGRVGREGWRTQGARGATRCMGVRGPASGHRDPRADNGIRDAYRNGCHPNGPGELGWTMEAE
jgi:hypothetical protein